MRNTWVTRAKQPKTVTFVNHLFDSCKAFVWLLRNICVTLAKQLNDSCKAHAWPLRNTCVTRTKHLCDSSEALCDSLEALECNSYESLEWFVRSSCVTRAKHMCNSREALESNSYESLEWLVRNSWVTRARHLCDSCFVLTRTSELFESFRRSHDAHRYFSANQIACYETSNSKKCAVERQSLVRAKWASKLIKCVTVS